MKSKKFTKEELLEFTNNGEDFFKLVFPNLLRKDTNSFKQTFNPFYNDRNPAVSVYRINEEDRWRFKDHGDDTYAGDMFDLAAWHYDLAVEDDFPEILRRIAEDLKLTDELTTPPKAEKEKHKITKEESITDGIYFENENDKYLYELHQQQEPMFSAGYEFEYDSDDQGRESAAIHFQQFGITRKILKEYNVRGVNGYYFEDEFGERKFKYFQEKSLVIAYVATSFVKFYCPYPKRFWYLNHRDPEFMFGMSQIFTRSWRRLNKTLPKTIVITGGEKDVLALRAIGYEAIAFASETSSVPKYFIDSYKDAFRNIIILYDNDEAGDKGAERVSTTLKENGFENVNILKLPSLLKEKKGKDISDYLKLKLDINELHTLIKQYEKTTSKTESLTTTEFIKKQKPTTPFLPDKVYELLPYPLKELTDLFGTRRDKDVSLLSLIGVLSSCFPNIKGVYAGKYIGCNIFLFITAPASSGKGVMTWSKVIANGIEKYLKEKNKKQKANSLSDSNGKKEKPAAQESGQKEYHLFIPANSSSSTMYEYLDANENYGIIFDSEGDTLSAVMKNEWADFSSLLRKAFHHEHASMARRTNKEHREIENPHLSIILSGTRNQVDKLIDSVENGLFSRIVFYDFDAEVIWQNFFGNKEDSMDIMKKFQIASDTILKYWLHAETSTHSTFFLKDEHQKQASEYFTNKLSEMYKIYGDDIVGSVKRICVVYYRIAMILSALTNYQKMNPSVNKLPAKMIIGDKESECALLIVDTLLDHLEIVFNRMQKDKLYNKLNTLQHTLCNALPEEFTWQQFVSLAESLNIKFDAAQKYRRDFLKLNLIVNAEHGKYKKIK